MVRAESSVMVARRAEHFQEGSVATVLITGETVGGRRI